MDPRRGACIDPCHCSGEWRLELSGLCRGHTYVRPWELTCDPGRVGTRQYSAGDYRLGVEDNVVKLRLIPKV